MAAGAAPITSVFQTEGRRKWGKGKSRDDFLKKLSLKPLTPLLHKSHWLEIILMAFLVVKEAEKCHFSWQYCHRE